MAKAVDVKALKLKRNAEKRARRARIEARVIEGQVPRAAYSIPEFCAAHRISEGFYYKLRHAGLGPRECRVLNKVTISLEAAGEWRRARENATQT